MIGLWITIAVLTAVALGLLLVPLARRGRAPAPTRAAYDITVYRDQLAEVDRDLERGLFGDDQAHAARIEIQRRMLAAGPEDGSGGTISVDAAELAQSLTGARTPVVLVNTSSASALNDVMSFAAGLAQGGVPQVVAAPVPIAGAGRVLFCENFFEGLSSGAPIAAAQRSQIQLHLPHPHIIRAPPSPLD